MATTTTITATVDVELVELPSTPKNASISAAPEPEEPATAPNNGLDRATFLKLMSAAFSFFVAGVNDGSIGALVPHFMREYGINTSIVSSVFAANFFGWLFAAVSNTHLCQYLDLGAMLALGAVFQLAAQALRAWNLPFGLLAFTFWLTSVGQAYQDTHANTFVAKAHLAHRWLGFVHAMYMAGCLVGPFVATAVASAGTVSRWYLFYTFPLGLGVVNLAWVLVTFRDSVRLLRRHVAEPAQSENAPQQDTEEQVSRSATAAKLIKDAMRTPSVWFLSTFYFFYLGAAITAGGWLVEYLVAVRGGDLSQMGYVSAGYNGGGLLGRLLLAEPTTRWGERRMILIYCVLCIGFQLVFWLVPHIIAASIAVSFLGFFSGPFFATGISVGSKLFSPDIHSTALAFVFVIAQIGGSIFPIITGLLATRVGVAVLQPVLVGLFAATAIAWLLVPNPKSTANPALHEE